MFGVSKLKKGISRVVKFNWLLPRLDNYQEKSLFTRSLNRILPLPCDFFIFFLN